MLYHRALEALHRAGMLFPCKVTRKALRARASDPDNRGASPYPRSLRPEHFPKEWLNELLREKTPSASVRFRVSSATTSFEDGLYGRIHEDVSHSTGDFVVRRRDGLWAYQLAVVVDDADQGITEVVRGSDLLSSTARQILLQRALGLKTPSYLHVPILTNSTGDKLSKRNGSLSIRNLRDAGWRPQDVTGELAVSLGMIETPRPLTPTDLLDHYDLRKLNRREMPVPAAFLQEQQAPAET